jgi:glycosyltransferase involved in cell wall biosynthesis
MKIRYFSTQQGREDRAVVILVFFNAEMGGLQEHVRAQARGLAKRGFQPTVVCRPGVFEQSLREEQIPVITTNFENPIEDVDRLLAEIPEPAIIHAHPFASRRLGQRLAERTGRPLFVTFHGSYADGIANWGDAATTVVAVSPGIGDLLVAASPSIAERIIVLPNAVDLTCFHPGSQRIGTPRGFEVVVPSRFDADKSLLVDLLRVAWGKQAEESNGSINWVLAGDGTSLPVLMSAADDLARAIGRSVVAFPGWQTPSDLAKLLRRADAAVAPGRSALESMASGTPTNAVGSKGYFGPTWESIHGGMYSNFGGVITHSIDHGGLLQDIERLKLLSSEQRSSIGVASRVLVSAFYDQSRVDGALAALYEMQLVTD